jgi:putative membrane protein
MESIRPVAPADPALNDSTPVPPDSAVAAVPAGFEGLDGFLAPLGSRASIGMDVVLVGLLALLPVLAWSIAAVRAGRYRLHKRLQLFIVGALAAAIVVFEIDIRIFSDWRERARPSPFWPAGVLGSLGVHLVFAISTFLLWTWVVLEAVARFPVPPAPGRHGPRHRWMARLAAVDLLGTALTGVVFYWLAFVA